MILDNAICKLRVSNFTFRRLGYFHLDFRDHLIDQRSLAVIGELDLLNIIEQIRFTYKSKLLQGIYFYSHLMFPVVITQVLEENEKFIKMLI